MGQARTRSSGAPKRARWTMEWSHAGQQCLPKTQQPKGRCRGDRATPIATKIDKHGCAWALQSTGLPSGRTSPQKACAAVRSEPHSSTGSHYRLGQLPKAGWVEVAVLGSLDEFGPGSSHHDGLPLKRFCHLCRLFGSDQTREATGHIRPGEAVRHQGTSSAVCNLSQGWALLVLPARCERKAAL